MILQIVQLVDLVLNLNTGFTRKRKLVTCRKEIAQNHITKWFALEVVSAIPVSIAFGFEDALPEKVPRILLHYDAVLIALRVFRAAINTQHLLLSYVLRENEQLASWFQYSRYSHLLGIAKLMWLTVLVAHYMACLWHIVAEHQDPVTSVAEQYIADVYYAVQLTQGQGGVTGTWSENLLSTFVILAGSVILAIVFGNVAVLVSNFSANTTNFEQKMQGVFATMGKMSLPLKLRDRVQQYYAHVWWAYGSMDDDIAKFQRELTHILGLEVGLYKYMDLIGKISFWENCSPDFVMQIIRNLGVRAYLPDDYVIRKDEIGDEMFMINRGICILSDAMEIYNVNAATTRSILTRSACGQTINCFFILVKRLVS
ncbi:Potassium/sodium hyperpolarization-activated cyclic nucleotide-gated channel 4 [Phytophthora cinnamomi]|nr:Potassium/sodium hyperpolarization-activated cyclic nucleotide-gated channel 4 [Phytophthora cinnamomi]